MFLMHVGSRHLTLQRDDVQVQPHEYLVNVGTLILL